MLALVGLLAPVTVDTFFAEYWERQPLHVARDAAGYFADTYDVADIEESLVVGARDLERFALVKAGLPQASLEDYVVTSPAIRWKSTGKAPVAHVDPRKVARLLERGYTLVIKDAALLSARLQRSCNRLQRDLGAYVGANVYFTPAGAQGLDVHHDTHDTMTLQIEGTKTWRVYEPLVELPLESQQLHRGTRVPPLTLHREITLAAGETLYLPRGYAHEAVATEGRALHVTFALAPVRVIDLLHETLDAVATGDVALRRALPGGWQTDPTFAATFAAEMGPRLAGITADTVAHAANTALGELFAASRSEANAAFDQLIHISKIRRESLLRMNDDLPFLIRKRANAIDLLLPGTSLSLSKSCLPALERLQGGPVRFGDLAPELSAPDRQVLVKTLAREGLLLVDDPG
jgi:bifunctional lysine-specific demethylase and histidyl-hydroxylase NO66